MPASQHPHLSELPIWLLFILASLSGIAGEMWRAEALGFTPLARRALQDQIKALDAGDSIAKKYLTG